MTIITPRDAPSAVVYLDRKDVSTICIAADPDAGWVDLLPDGKFKADKFGNVFTERLFGQVEVLPVYKPLVFRGL